MTSQTDNSKQASVEKKAGLKPKIVPTLMLLLMIAISVGLFLYRDKVAELGGYGYLSAFIICLVGNASVILPVPGILLFFPLVTTFNPVLLGLVGATGGTIGEVTGYMAGYSGRVMIQNVRMFDRMNGWMKKQGVLVIFLFAAVPFLLVDIAGLVAGTTRYPLWKFLLVVWVGKSLKYIILLMAAALGWATVVHYFAG
ncbi:MAG: VTT domain-containing protein [Chloroflexi bacterium]|nr:VTT domain-containing protein [Chloroflexota bacterium]